MNRQNHPELIVSGIHLELTPSLKTFVQEKAERLFRHEERILRLRVELESDPKERFGGKVQGQGPRHHRRPGDECVSGVGRMPQGAWRCLTDKLDRMLSRRAQLLKVKRHHPHAVELGVPLPKAV